LTLAPGEALPAYRIPAVPEKTGMSGEWENLSEMNLDEILYDMTFTVRYENHAISISSSAAEGDRPLLLAEGLFGLDARLNVAEADHFPQLSDREVLLGCWEPVLSGQAHADSLRFLIPDTDDAENLLVYILDDSGTWRQEWGTVSGSYLVFPWQAQDLCFAIAQSVPDYTWWYLAGGGIAVLAAAVTVAAVVKRKRKSTPPEQAEE